MISNETLLYLLEIAKAGSITQAAHNLYMSQPHLSNIVRTFEQEIGFIIFKRSTKGIEITNEGRKFLRRAQCIVDRTLELEYMYCHPSDDRLSISISITRSYQILKKMIKFINDHQNYPEINIRFKEGDPFQTIEDVASGASDFGVIHFFESQKSAYLSYLKTKGLLAHCFYNREYLIAMSESNPLAHKKTVSKEDIKNQMVVLYGDYENSWMSYESVVDMADLLASPKRIYVYDRGGAMDVLNGCHNSISWISGLNKETLDQYNLVLRRCSDLHVRNVGVIIYREHMDLPPLCQQFYDIICSIDWTEEVTEEIFSE